MHGKPLSNGDLLIQLKELLFREAIEGKAIQLEHSTSTNQAVIRGILAQNTTGVRRGFIDVELHRDSLFRTVFQEEIDESLEIDIIALPDDDEDSTFTGLTPFINLEPMED
jgi:hypothetical protein